jgi:hypothetical protein
MKFNRLFKETYRHDLQGQRVGQARNQHEAGSTTAHRLVTREAGNDATMLGC